MYICILCVINILEKNENINVMGLIINKVGINYCSGKMRMVLNWF